MRNSIITPRSHCWEGFREVKVTTGCLRLKWDWVCFCGCRLQELLEAAEDMAIDIPHIWLYLAELITPMLHEGGIHMGQLFRWAPVLKSCINCVNDWRWPDFTLALNMQLSNIKHESVGFLWHTVAHVPFSISRINGHILQSSRSLNINLVLKNGWNVIQCNFVSREISKPLVPLGKAGVLLVQILRLLCKGMVCPTETLSGFPLKQLFHYKMLQLKILSRNLHLKLTGFFFSLDP